MAEVLVFPDDSSFSRAFSALSSANVSVEVLEPPQFCHGLVAKSILLSGRHQSASDQLSLDGLQPCGLLQYRCFTRVPPQASPPDPRWKDVIGGYSICAARTSSTDPNRISFEISTQKDLTPLIPVMARLIRGGTFNPDIPILAFEEEYRLLAVSPHRIWISRADDMLDMWIMLRTMTDLLLSTWSLCSSLEPERGRRYGISSSEFFRRLPATDCGLCGRGGCMEFALGLTLGQCTLAQCPQLDDGALSENTQSLQRLMEVLGHAP